MSLIDNPKLNSIPSCIADLPSLTFLNLRGTNVDVPDSIKEKGIDMGNGMWDLEG